MKKFLIIPQVLLLLILIGGNISCSDDKEDDSSRNRQNHDREILMSIYNALGGDDWNNNENWGTDKELSLWHGVKLVDDCVTELDLEDNNLCGTLPTEIGDLTNIKKININWNNISGTFPSSIENLKNLEQFRFYGNYLSGDIPTILASLPDWPINGWLNVLQYDSNFNFSTLHLSIPEFSQEDLMTSKLVSNVSVMQEKELTLVYFWSDAEAKNDWANKVRKYYQRYNDKGLNVLGVYVGSDTDTARKEIVAKGMEGWTHIFMDEPVFYIVAPTVAIFDKSGQLLFYDYYQDIDSDLPLLLEEKLEGITSLYESTDYSKDGSYEVLQKASEGNGINIVLMGDAYTDRLQADGTYTLMMNKACHAFFSEQPYTDFQHLFNVYYVNVVSANEIYTVNSNTALECKFGEGTYVEGNWDKCIEYAQKIPEITSDNIENTLIIVMMNSSRYAGTCHMRYYSDWTTDYGEGNAVAYFPVGESDEDLAHILHHEAGGHGFGKLADEYYYNKIPQDMEKEKEKLQIYRRLGWFRNIDITNDPAQVSWSKFIDDVDYAPENISIFEGAYTYLTGFYRPTYTSIMDENVGGFNAPSRERIYYRIHKLAYGENWTYDYEKFKEYDKKNIRDHGTARTVTSVNFVPLAPPVVKIIHQ